MARSDIRESGVSLGTTIKGQPSFRATAPALWIRFEQFPLAMVLSVPMEQGTITVPWSRKEPDEIGAEKSLFSCMVIKACLPSGPP